MVDINPGRLHDEGLAAALDDLAAPLRARGVEVRLDVPADLALPEGAEQLLYRAAGEALRNVAAHADAGHVGVSVVRDDGRARLRVQDDGAASTPPPAPAAATRATWAWRWWRTSPRTSAGAPTCAPRRARGPWSSWRCRA